MKNCKDISVGCDASIKDVLRIIDKGAMQIALVVDADNKLLGTITDGDIRRGLLDGYDLSSSIEHIINRTPTVAKISDTKEDILKVALLRKLHQIPIVDELGKVLGIQEIDGLIASEVKPNKVVLMVGGLGTRLMPLTADTPKPMLKVGDKPILQTIVEKFVEYGFREIVMCVNYKSKVIQDYFKDGSEFGAKIKYVLEKQRMGTAGALGLLSKVPNEPFIVMNGDLLTNLNFEHLLHFHITNNSTATMCIRGYDFQVPYGVVNVKDGKILSIQEKPLQKFFVSAGIYVLSPDVLKYIPQDEFFDMPTLFEKIIEDGKNALSFPIREYWLDIGRIEEYERANDEYNKVF